MVWGTECDAQVSSSAFHLIDMQSMVYMVESCNWIFSNNKLRGIPDQISRQYEMTERGKARISTEIFGGGQAKVECDQGMRVDG